jgi:hypothetical protein
MLADRSDQKIGTTTGFKAMSEPSLKPKVDKSPARRPSLGQRTAISKRDIERYIRPVAEVGVPGARLAAKMGFPDHGAV